MKKEGHLLLRVKLKLKGIEHRELARMMDVCPAYLSFRFTGKEPWKINEIYFILHLLDAESTEIPELFPESDCYKVIKRHI